MTGPLRLVIFDVDGTLVDSQASILAAMASAFDAVGLALPGRVEVLSIVGLSLDRAMARLVPQADTDMLDRLVDAYKAAYFLQRHEQGADAAPLYPGAREVLTALGGAPDVLLGVATGKSRRGLDALLAAQGLEGVFVTRQVADDHPSKPHPSMIHAALSETGVDPAHAVMIGDTASDMDMARAGGIAGVGVGWGYHPADRLGASHGVIDRFDHLPPLLGRIWDAAT